MKNTSLVVVGSGVKFFSHLTSEAIAHIEQSDRVLYLVNEPAIKEWLHKANSQAESLEVIYYSYNLRLESYRAITDYILEAVRKGGNICVVLYGHPTIYAKPAIDAVLQAKNEGFSAKILPGISAEDCMFADLLIDPGTVGCYSLDATDILIHKRRINSCSHLVIWQIGVIGSIVHSKTYDPACALEVLIQYLNNFYDLDHQVILYSAAQFPGFNPQINKIKLRQLSKSNITRITTLYIPPATVASVDLVMLEALKININDLN